MNNLPTFESLVLILPKKNSEFTRDEGAGGTFWVVQNEVEVDDDAWMKVRLTDDLKKQMKTTDMLPLMLIMVSLEYSDQCVSSIESGMWTIFKSAILCKPCRARAMISRITRSPTDSSVLRSLLRIIEVPKPAVIMCHLRARPFP